MSGLDKHTRKVIHIADLRPHRGAPRQIRAGQHIHKSVFVAMGIDIDTLLSSEASIDLPAYGESIYTPSARFGRKDYATWDEVYKLAQQRLEDDPFVSAEVAIQNMKLARNADDTTFEAAIRVLENHILSKNQAAGDPAFYKGQLQGQRIFAV